MYSDPTYYIFETQKPISCGKPEIFSTYCAELRWSRGNMAQGQGHKKIQGQGQPFRGQTRSSQGQECSRPRTKVAKCFSKKKSSKFFSGDLKKRYSKFFFSRSSKEEYIKRLRKFSARFLAFSNAILRVQKIIQSSSRGQGNFRGLRLRDQGLDLRGQGQGLKNVSSRPRTSSRTPPLVRNVR